MLLPERTSSFKIAVGVRFAWLFVMITAPFSAVAQESSRRDIKITVGGKVVGRVVGEDIPLEYPDMVWRADPSIGMAADGTIYVALYM